MTILHLSKLLTIARIDSIIDIHYTVTSLQTVRDFQCNKGLTANTDI